MTVVCLLQELIHPEWHAVGRVRPVLNPELDRRVGGQRWGMVASRKDGFSWQMLLYDLHWAARVLLSEEAQSLLISQTSPQPVRQFTFLWRDSEEFWLWLETCFLTQN